MHIATKQYRGTRNLPRLGNGLLVLGHGLLALICGMPMSDHGSLALTYSTAK